MSSEAVAAPSEVGAPEPRAVADRRFRRTLLAVVTALVVLAGALTAGNAIRPPRVVAGEVNGPAVVERAGQRVLLRLDQRIAPPNAEAVSVTPAVDFELVPADGPAASVTLRFDAPLRSATRYEVRVADARGVATGATGALHYAFDTPDVEITALQRSPEGADRILRRALEGTETTTLFEADRIQEYAAVGQALAVVTLDGAGAASLVLTATDGGADVPPTSVLLPGAGTVQQLSSSGASGFVGWVFTSAPGAEPQVPGVLYLLDANDPSGVPQPVLGADGEPLSVLDWAWVPGTSSLVAQAPDQSLSLIDPVGGTPPSPLGAHAELRGFVPGTTTLLVADPDQGSTIDLSTGETAPLELPEAPLPDGAVPGRLLVIAGGESPAYIEQLTRFADPASRDPAQVSLRYFDTDGERELYAPAAAGTTIRDFCLSPNGQYLAVETASAEGLPDGYPSEPASTATSTVFVDVATGERRRGIDGFLVSWCR